MAVEIKIVDIKETRSFYLPSVHEQYWGVTRGTILAGLLSHGHKKNVNFKKAAAQKRLGGTEGLILVHYAARCHKVSLHREMWLQPLLSPSCEHPVGAKPAAEAPSRQGPHTQSGTARWKMPQAKISLLPSLPGGGTPVFSLCRSSQGGE